MSDFFLASTDVLLRWNCASIKLPWSITTSANPNATLAGVLAGFMVTASAFLFGWKDTQNRATVPAHTVSLFTAGVLVLGLDSYLFGTISAIAPSATTNGVVDDEAKFACAIAWTQGMPASSMLAVGGTVMIAGLGWMLTHYIVTIRDTDQSIPRVVVLLPGALTAIALITTGLLLIRTTLNYLLILELSFDKPSPFWVHDALWKGYWTFVAVVVVIIGLRTIGVLRASALTGRFLPLAWVAVWTAILACAGTVGASLLAEGITMTERVPSTEAIQWSVFLCIGPLVIIYIPLALAVPGPNNWGTIKWICLKIAARLETFRGECRIIAHYQ